MTPDKEPRHKAPIRPQLGHDIAEAAYMGCNWDGSPAAHTEILKALEDDDKTIEDEDRRSEKDWKDLERHLAKGRERSFWWV